jgi:hypothetical protein
MMLTFPHVFIVTRVTWQHDKQFVCSGFDNGLFGFSPGRATNNYALRFQSYNNCDTAQTKVFHTLKLEILVS